MGEDREQVRAHVAEFNWSFPVLLDPSLKVTQMYGVRATPTHYLVDPQGDVIGAGIGSRDWDGDEAHRLIMSLLPMKRPSDQNLRRR